MQLDLSDEEVRTFQGLLDDYLTRLRREIARTDAHEFRHDLVKRLDLCERLLDQLGRLPTA
jgi:hypothetical protein